MNTFDLSLKESFKSYSPTLINFGPNAFEEAGRLIASLGKKALVVTGSSACQTGSLSKLLVLCEREGVEARSYSKVTSDPTDVIVNDIGRLIKDSECQVVVGLGGGSAIDAAKAAAAVAGCGKSARKMLSQSIGKEEDILPIVAIPTTAGTGSELSKGAIISCPDLKLKSGIRSEKIIPRIALVDPLLTLTVPEKQVRITGFDIFTHAIETMISRRASPLTISHSLKAIDLVTRTLPEALRDPENVEHRTKLSYASMLMGYNLANSSTCLPHRLQYPLGMLTGTEHALGLAALYPAWVRTTASASEEKFRMISRCMNLGKESEPLMALDKFMSSIGLTPTLRDLGVDKSMCLSMSEMISGNLGNDPWWGPEKNPGDIYLRALGQQDPP